MLSPSRVDNSATSRRVFHPEASILLLGHPRAGKKTLAIIASINFARKYVEFDKFFAKHTGYPAEAYIAHNGTARYAEVVPVILQHLLDTHSLGCVISGLPSVSIRSQKALLNSFANTNPVIFIRRSRKTLKTHPSGRAGFSQVHNALQFFFFSCSNFDYFNLSPKDTCIPSTLKLKEVETDFVRFLNRILGRSQRLLYSRDPFSATNTYALQVRLGDVNAQFDYTQLESGVDMINLITDDSEGGMDFHDQLVQKMALLRRHTRVPVILDIETKCTDAQSYFESLNLGLRTCPDAMTVNLRSEIAVEKIVSQKGCTNLIGTYHHSENWTSLQDKDFFSLQAASSNLLLHALRLSKEARSRDDNLHCSSFVHAIEKTFNLPIIAYNTGCLGRTSICFNRVLSPVSLGDYGVTAKQARTALCKSFMLEPLTFTIIGLSVSYSLSPAMHNAAYAFCGMPHVYNICQSDKFEDIHQLLNQNCGGITISMPFKSTVLSLLDFVSPEARQIGAVNTVVVNRQHETILKGYNTDHIGIKQCLYNNLSPANSVRKTTTALIIGAGGMARAAVYAFQTMGIKQVCICNRTQRRALQLAERYRSVDCELRVLDLHQDWPMDLEQPTVIVSTIPAHKINDNPAHELNIPEKWLRSISGGTFVELAYQPLETRFIKQMRQVRGWIVVDGLSVLLEQGIAQFEIFTGSPAPIHTMKNALKEQYASASTSDNFPSRAPG